MFLRGLKIDLMGNGFHNLVEFEFEVIKHSNTGLS